jgi:ArsR family transcriptional regulator
MNKKEFTQLFKALSDETRLEIIEMLQDGERCACEILQNFQITQPTLSYHMRLLCESKLVLSRRDGAWMRYSLNKKTFENLKNWIEIMSLENSSVGNITCDCFKK